MKKKDGPYRKESSWRPIVDAIDNYYTQYGFCPTVREIADAVGKGSTTVQFHIEKLIEDGIITKQPGKIRTIRVVK